MYYKENGEHVKKLLNTMCHIWLSFNKGNIIETEDIYRFNEHCNRRIKRKPTHTQTEKNHIHIESIRKR